MIPQVKTSSPEIFTSERSAFSGYPLGFTLLVVLVGFEFLRPQEYFPAIGVLRIGMLLQIAIAFYLITSIPFKIPAMGYGILGFIGLMAVGIPFAYNNHYAYGMTKYMAQLFLAFFLPILIFLNNPRRLRKFILWYILIHVALAILATMNKGRGTGHFLEDENDLCLAFNVILPFVYFSILRVKTPRARAFYVTALILILLAIVATKSRGGFVGLVPVLLYCFWHTPQKKDVLKILVGLIFLSAIFVPSTYWEEMKTIRQGTQDSTGDERIYSWKLGLWMFLEDPLIGVGAGNYQAKNHLYQGTEKAHGRKHMWGRVAHSMYFTLLPELGIAGVLIFLYLLRLFHINNKSIQEIYSNNVTDTHYTIQNDNDNNNQNVDFYYYLNLSLNGGMIGLLVTGIFISVLYYPHFWILLSLSSALMQVSSKERKLKCTA